MNELLQATLWAAGLFTLVPGLLYVLAVIDPQTQTQNDGRSASRQVRTS